MKKVIAAILILFLFINTASSDITISYAEIMDGLRSEGVLDMVIGEVNTLLDQIPQLSMVIGTDRIYHARLGGINLGIIIQNGRVTDFSFGTPDNPTHLLYLSFDSITNIITSGDPVNSIISLITQGGLVITPVSECQSNNACDDDEVCMSGSCEDAYTLIVVPIGYSSGEGQAFLSAAQPEMELVEQYLPMNENYMRIHYVDPSVCADNTCNDACGDCQNTAASCAQNAGLSSVADKVLGVSKYDTATYWNGQEFLICGCAGGIPAHTSVSRARLFADGGVYCYQTVVHELGHQVGLYHVDATGEEGGACQGVNAADCNEANKASDIMGYGWPQDHWGPAATSYLTNTVLGDYQ